MTLLRTPSYESSLSQAERLALCDGRFSPLVLAPDSIGTPPPAPRFPSPRMDKVRENDARLSFYGSSCNVSDEALEDDEMSDESELAAFAVHKRRDSMREYSLLMPSQRGYAAAWQEAREYGFAND